MLDDTELRSLAAGITSLSAESTHYNDQLQDLLERFKNLLRDYSAMRENFEEGEKTRQFKKQVDRHSFVLVLLDADGYLVGFQSALGDKITLLITPKFQDRYLQRGSEGGIDVAHELRDRIHDLMLSNKQTRLQECQIMVRAYANVLGLSRALARAGIVHDGTQALLEFTTAFTRGQDLFDFVDAGTKKESSDFKIREMFRLFTGLDQCHHIYFGGCHDVGYLSMLTPYKGRNDLITLLRAGSFHRDFEALDLSIEELPSVFKSTRLDARDYQMGLEKRNPFLLRPTSPQPLADDSQKRLDGVCENRFNNQLPTCPSSSDLQEPCTNYVPDSLVTRHLDDLFSVNLPRRSSTTEDHIPLNRLGRRLDFFCPSPSAKALEEYRQRVAQQKVCNSYQLAGSCNRKNCPYDHGSVSDAIIEVQKHIMVQYPCAQLGACRSRRCFFGHHCQLASCGSTDIHRCRFDPHSHISDPQDLQTFEWVPATGC